MWKQWKLDSSILSWSLKSPTIFGQGSKRHMHKCTVKNDKTNLELVNDQTIKNSKWNETILWKNQWKELKKGDKWRSQIKEGDK